MQLLRSPKPAEPAATPSTDHDGTNAGTPQPKKSNTGKNIGIGVGVSAGALFLITIALIAFTIVKRRRKAFPSNGDSIPVAKDDEAKSTQGMGNYFAKKEQVGVATQEIPAPPYSV